MMDRYVRIVNGQAREAKAATARPRCERLLNQEAGR